MPTRAKTAAMVLLVSVALGACAVPSSPIQPVPTPGGAGGGGLVPRPGLDKRADGTAVARGWVVHSDLEGGFWTLVDAAPDADASGKVVVVLLPGKVTEAEIAALDGSYASATGRMKTGASIRMSGPEMTVETIEKLAPNTP